MAPNSDTHTWTVFVRSAASPLVDSKSRERERALDEELLPGGADDMSHFLKRVSFRLHDSFPTPLRSASDDPPPLPLPFSRLPCPVTRGEGGEGRASGSLADRGMLSRLTCLPACSPAYLLARVGLAHPQRPDIDRPPYQVTETGWGEFPLQIRLTFIQEANEKPIHIVHNLKLHHYLPVVPAPPPPPPGGSGSTVEAESGSIDVGGGGQVASLAEAGGGGQGSESARPMQVDVAEATALAGRDPVEGIAAQVTAAGQTKVCVGDEGSGDAARRRPSASYWF